jgi:nucleoside-diphosphate-sugar epimerase
MKIAILGANSHIAKGLINNLLAKRQDTLCLFTRSVTETGKFLAAAGHELRGNCVLVEGYRDFLKCGYDVIINCVGTGTPDKLGNDYSVWFTLTEEFDNLCLACLRSNPDTLYVNFSSGAVYGKDGSAPATEHTVNCIEVNHIIPADYYTIARLNSEAKHRAFAAFKIVDIRIFAYFSRFIDLNSGYFIAEVMNCIRNKRILQTNAADMVRDYIHPDDLLKLVLKCAAAGKINVAFDAVSAAPAEKFQILDFFKSEYGLQYEIDGTRNFGSPNGSKNIYCSNYNKASGIGYMPGFSSMDAIEQEAQYITGNN